MKYAKRTQELIAIAVKNGAEIVENKNYKYTGHKAGFQRVEMLARTNSRIHGFPKRIIWACYK